MIKKIILLGVGECTILLITSLPTDKWRSNSI